MEIKDGGHPVPGPCYRVDGFEFAGEETVIQFCHGMEPPTFSAHARYHHPTWCARLPSCLQRKGREGPVCIWEYYIAEQDTK